jgi:hypothetical protein
MGFGKLGCNKLNICVVEMEWLNLDCYEELAHQYIDPALNFPNARGRVKRLL